MTWNFDISEAPRSKYVEAVQHREKGDVTVIRFVSETVILATKCGKVTLSHWLPEGKDRKAGRWHMLNDNEEPVAWMPWPEHPELAS